MFSFDLETNFWRKKALLPSIESISLKFHLWLIKVYAPKERVEVALQNPGAWCPIRHSWLYFYTIRTTFIFIFFDQSSSAPSSFPKCDRALKRDIYRYQFTQDRSLAGFRKSHRKSNDPRQFADSLMHAQPDHPIHHLNISSQYYQLLSSVCYRSRQSQWLHWALWGFYSANKIFTSNTTILFVNKSTSITLSIATWGHLIARPFAGLRFWNGQIVESKPHSPSLVSILVILTVLHVHIFEYLTYQDLN